MKLSQITITMFLLCLTACLKTKTETQSSYGMNQADRAMLAAECKAMAEEGDILALLKIIKKDTDTVLSVLDSENPEKQVAKVSALADRISDNSERVKSLAKGEWVETKYEHTLKWKINVEDFKDLLGAHVGGFSLRDFEVNSVYYMGQKRSDIIPLIETSGDENEITVKYSSRGSSLELCQLEKTMMIVVEVKYRNVLVKGTRYFNLISRR